ncbi:hypothetical protein GCM10011367_14060 [Marinicauda pacifica]|uniref:Uncharacterized protein n=1 Tax=Marinicauda pacifica TaxID=1133559 RepID=A0A4S2HBG5_9PROT|nr:hypothetical protein [Marinicauda pacifica]TGY92832.1 hypothetical protein E5162_07100 [Marinicauda pacifica]GGE40684.1 hypothetical protein GCM10011367_14060 [Marinicauda pacifica]
MKHLLFSAAGALVLVACGTDPDSAQEGTETESTLFAALQSLCGDAFEGEVVSDDPADADWAGEVLTVHVRTCTDDMVRMPLHVGDDRSRTWVVTRLEDGRLRLKHDHRHEDGSEDALTQYGGDTEGEVDDLSARFPADDFSRDLFEREGIPASMDNVWTLAIEDGGDTLVYALDRPGRHFEARIDLTETVSTPPAPWGAEPGTQD